MLIAAILLAIILFLVVTFGLKGKISDLLSSPYT